MRSGEGAPVFDAARVEARGDGRGHAAHLPISPANFETAILKDTKWYGSLYDRIEARFGAWLGG